METDPLTLAEAARNRAELLRCEAEDGRTARERLREAAEAARAAGEVLRLAAERSRHHALGELNATAETMEATLEHMQVVEEMRRALRAIQDQNDLAIN